MNFSKAKPFLRCVTILLSLALSLVSLNVNAQNCTVNAGINETLCPGQAMVLKGNSTGLFYSGGTAVWSQVSGPAVTIGTPVISGSNINATVTGYSPGNTYVFRITARCADGSQVYQDVTFTTLSATVANAGANIAATCPGTVTMAANAPGSGDLVKLVPGAL